MTVAALRLSRAANAVAQLHGKTAAKMWDWVEGIKPIIPITNGVHMRSWQDDRLAEAAKPTMSTIHFGESISSSKMSFFMRSSERPGRRCREILYLSDLPVGLPLISV